MSVAVPAKIRTAEILRFEPVTHRSSRMFMPLESAARAVGISARQTSRYEGASDVLVLWGVGSPLRWPAMQQQLDRGKHYIGFDLAYWNREIKFRLTIDAAHPQAWVMSQNWPSERFADDHPVLGNVWDPCGPVVIAGIGVKSKVQYGAARVLKWEYEQITLCRHAGRSVIYRQKNGLGEVPSGVPLAGTALIDTVLRGASLVVTWHSNVAIDAIRLGIPAVCCDGAAAAVCPSTVSAQGAFVPLEAGIRDRFLQNLAWFQWAPDEASTCWRFLQDVLSC